MNRKNGMKPDPGKRSAVASLILALVLAFAWSASPLLAQEYRARVQGFVTDPSKAGVVAADVVLKNEGTGVSTTRRAATWCDNKLFQYS
jgi:hypothetical protein